MSDQPHNSKLKPLLDFLARIPAVETADDPSMDMASEVSEDSWWVRFSLDIDSEIAWETVQEIAHALNDSANAGKPAALFYPISPAPAQSGGPEEFLSWVIEAGADVDPASVAAWLESMLPNPVEESDAWLGSREDDDISGPDDDEEDDSEDEADETED